MSEKLSARLYALQNEKAGLEKDLHPYWEILRDRWNAKNLRLSSNLDGIEISDGKVTFHSKYDAAVGLEFGDAALELEFEDADLTPEELRAKMEEIQRIWQEYIRLRDEFKSRKGMKPWR